MSHELLDHQEIRRWSGAVLVIFILVGLSFGTWLSRLPAVRDELGATTAQMSIYGLCLAGGSLFGLVFSGGLIQRWGPRTVIAVSICVQALALPGAVSLILGGLLPVGLIILVMYGFAFSTTDVAMNVSGAFAERLLGKPRLPLMHAGYSLGTVAAMGLGAVAESAGIAPQLHFVVVLAAIVLVAFAMLPRIPGNEERLRELHEAAAKVDAAAEHNSKAEEASSAPGTPDATATSSSSASRRYTPWRDPRVLIIGVIALSAGLLEGTASDWLPLALVDGRGLGNDTSALMLGVFFASAMAARIAGAAVLARLGRVVTLRASAVVASLGIVTVILVPGDVAITLGAVLWGLGSGLGWPVAIAAAADRPESAVRGVAAVSAVGYASMLIGPMAFGFLGEHIGLLLAFWALLVFTALIVLLAGVAREREVPPRSS